MKLGKLKNAQLSKQSHEIGFVQRVQLFVRKSDLRNMPRFFNKACYFTVFYDDMVDKS
jgi:hypothetical protein